MTDSVQQPGLHLVISGAGGLIGSALVSALERDGQRVTRLSRGAEAPGTVSWNPSEADLDLSSLPPIDAVVHLAGENIARRWTPVRKARIRESRVKGTGVLARAIARLEPPPRVFVSASAIGIYGTRGDAILTEVSAPGNPARDFLVGVCMDWEAAAEPARAAGIRVVHPRFGIVLSRHAGALAKLLLPFRLGLGGRVGNGSQWMSWVAIDDVVGIIRRLMTDERLSGPVNVTTPEPVPNREFSRVLGRVLHRPTPFPVPAAALRLALGEMAEGTLLASARVHPSRLQESGYRFEYPGLESALRHVLKQPEQ